MDIAASVKGRIENPAQLTMIISIVNIILLYPFVNSNISLAIFFIIGGLNLMYIGLFMNQMELSEFRPDINAAGNGLMQYISYILLHEYNDWNKESRFVPQWMYKLYLVSKAILKWFIIYLTSSTLWNPIVDFFSYTQNYVWMFITGLLISTTYGSTDNLFAKSNALISILLFSIALIITAISASDLFTKYSAKSDKPLELPREDRINHDNMKSSGLIGLLLCFGILWLFQKMPSNNIVNNTMLLLPLNTISPEKTKPFRNIITIGSSPILYYALKTLTGSIHLHGRTKQLNL